MLHEELLRLAEEQHGVVGRRQVRRLGLSRRSIAHLWSGTPHWEVVTAGVIRRRGAPRTDASLLMAAVLDVADDAVVSQLCAARWWGHRGCSLRPVTVSTTSRSSTSASCPTSTVAPGSFVHRVRRLEGAWTTQLDAVPIVRPEFLAMQLFDVCQEQRAERLVEWLWAERLLSGPSIHRFLDTCGARGRNGIGGLRRYLEARPSDDVPAASGVEARAMQLFEEAGIPMRRQVDVGATQWTGRVDFLHERSPIVVEIQSQRHHAALVDVEADARRIARLEADGFVVVEISDDDVWTRPGSVAPAVLAACRALAP